MATGARARIEDVAAAAGVSIKTVSRVMNREPGVRPETRERVTQAAEALVLGQAVLTGPWANVTKVEPGPRRPALPV